MISRDTHNSQCRWVMCFYGNANGIDCVETHTKRNSIYTDKHMDLKKIESTLPHFDDACIRNVLFFINSNLDNRILVYVLNYTVANNAVIPHPIQPFHVYICDLSAPREFTDVSHHSLVQVNMYKPRSIVGLETHGITTPLLCRNENGGECPVLVTLNYSKKTSRAYAKAPFDCNEGMVETRIKHFTANFNRTTQDIEDVRVYGEHNKKPVESSIHFSPQTRQSFDSLLYYSIFKNMTSKIGKVATKILTH